MLNQPFSVSTCHLKIPKIKSKLFWIDLSINGSHNTRCYLCCDIRRDLKTDCLPTLNRYRQHYLLVNFQSLVRESCKGGSDYEARPSLPYLVTSSS